MAPRMPGPDITAFYANGSASDTVYGPGDNLTLRFSAPTDRAPALWAPGVPGSLPNTAVSQLLSCRVNVGGEARAVPLGVVEGAWVADDMLRLSVVSTDGAAPGPTLTTNPNPDP